MHNLFCSGLALSGGGLNHTTSGLMTSVISLGLLNDHLNKGRQLYKVHCVYLRVMCVCCQLRAQPQLQAANHSDTGYEQLNICKHMFSCSHSDTGYEQLNICLVAPTQIQVTSN